MEEVQDMIINNLTGDEMVELAGWLVEMAAEKGDTFPDSILETIECDLEDRGSL